MPKPSHMTWVKPVIRTLRANVVARSNQMSIAMLTPANIAKPSVCRNKMNGNPRIDGYSRTHTLAGVSSSHTRIPVSIESDYERDDAFFVSNGRGRILSTDVEIEQRLAGGSVPRQ